MAPPESCGARAYRPARFAGRPAGYRNDVPVPAVSVVMITRDRAGSACRTAERLVQLPERPEVVVVDNGSSDGTAAMLRRAVPGARVIALADNLGAAGRNVGVQRAGGEVVAFADDDSWWPPGSLALAAQLLRHHPGVGLLTARTLVGPDAVDDPLNAVLAGAPLGREAALPGPEVAGFLACASVVRRRAFLQAGGFPAAFGVGGEEEWLALRLAELGWWLCYVPDLVARHSPDEAAPRPGRAARSVRNRLWTAWSLLPADLALRVTVRVARQALRDPVARGGLVAAAGAAPAVLARRRPVGPRAAAIARQLAA
jgi:GT2 family glycosyltransferase